MQLTFYETEIPKCSSTNGCKPHQIRLNILYPRMHHSPEWIIKKIEKKLSLWIVCVLNNSKPKYWQNKWIFNEFGKPLSDYVILHLWSFLRIPNPKIFFKKIDRWDVILLGIASPEHMMHVMYNSFSWSDTDRIGVHWTGISKKRNPLTYISCFHFSYCAVWNIQSCHMAHGKKWKIVLKPSI